LLQKFFDPRLNPTKLSQIGAIGTYIVYVGGIPHDASEKDPKGFCESVGEVTEDDERQRLARE
ncbi:hypothetical protein IFM89_009591, partial [Coptis chinensis]